MSEIKNEGFWISAEISTALVAGPPVNANLVNMVFAMPFDFRKTMKIQKVRANAWVLQGAGYTMGFGNFFIRIPPSTAGLPSQGQILNLNYDQSGDGLRYHFLNQTEYDCDIILALNAANQFTLQMEAGVGIPAGSVGGDTLIYAVSLYIQN